MKKVFLVLVDGVNCVFDGLSKKHARKIVKETKLYVDNFRHTALYKIGAWDGKDSHFKEDGKTYQFMLPRLIPMVESLGYEIEIIDDRPILQPPHVIDKDFLSEYGIELRDWQVEAANKFIDNPQGLLEAATGAGKTILCSCLCKMYGNLGLRTITIVPSEDLVKQTHKQYADVGLDVGMNHGKVTGKKKQEAFSKQHLVTTWQSLTRQRDRLESYDLVIYDEAHVLGDVMTEILSDELAFCMVRMACTGTIPESKWKRETLCCLIGGDVIYSKKAKALQDEGNISTIDIELIPVVHKINLPDEEWETEKKYLNKNRDRFDTILEFITNFSRDNVLILVQAELGVKLQKHLGLDFIDKDVKSDIRQMYYDRFENESNYKLLATFGTVATGISIDNIQTVILIDAGKSTSRVLQGLGRGLRLDGKDNHLKAYDLYAELWKFDIVQNKDQRYGFSSSTHLQKRKRMYKQEQYPFKKGKAIYVSAG